MGNPKQNLKKALFRILSWMERQPPQKASILMYHSVGDNAASFSVPARTFEKQLAHIRAAGYEPVFLSTLVQLLDSGAPIAGKVALTFDDGYEDNFSAAFPLLQEYNVPVSIFLTTGLLGKELENSEGISLPLLSIPQIQEMQASGLVEFLPHGNLHRKLGALKDEEAIEEIQLSKERIEELTGTEARIFAYPRGKYSERTIQLLKEIGFIAAVTVRPGRIAGGEAVNHFELPRIPVHKDTSLEEFRARLSRGGEWYERLKLWH